MSRSLKRKNLDIFDSFETPRSKAPPLQAKNGLQQALIESLYRNQLTFALGPAGTGKTYVATRIAAEMLEDKEVDRIVITRPVVEAGENMGFLPGKVEDKFAPYFGPVREILEEHFGGSHVSGMMKTGKIEIAPLAFMRGRTFKNSFVLFDEAQNTTPVQMKLFLTRLGEGSVVCVSGDQKQSDIAGHSGLDDALCRLRLVNCIGQVQFNSSHVVRSNLVQKIVEAYE